MGYWDNGIMGSRGIKKVKR